jgi:glycosyltransferase involved in cell wall biosynthesis
LPGLRNRIAVGFDATALLDAHLTGVGAFVQEVAGGLASRPEIDLTLFAVSWRGRNRLAGAAPDGATVRSRPVPARVARAAWSRTDHPNARLLAGPIDLVHGPNFVVPPGGGALEVVTVHDLTALHHPEMCTPDVLAWPGLLRRALHRGAWVHTVSEFVAAEVRDAFPESGDRVVAVPNGVRLPAPADASSDAETGRRLAGGDRYLLAVGTVEPRKDLPSLVVAFDALAATDADLRLVIAGADGLAAEALAAAIAASPHRERIIRLGPVPDDDRWALLRGATVVAYPSVYEGFGLVPLEAMAVGTAVVATAVGAIAEVVGDAAELVAPRDADALAAGLGRVLDDEDHRDRLIAAGADRVSRFSWVATVDGLVELYRTALDA